MSTPRQVELEWFQALLGGGGGVSLTALRSFRVLRVFKVFKHMPALAKIVGVLLSSAASFFSIGLLLFLFWTVFSIIGLHVFGELGTLTNRRESNFENIFQSYIILFQVRAAELERVPGSQPVHLAQDSPG